MAPGAKANTGKISRPTFFKTPAELRRWFSKHHASTHQLRIGFYKKHTGKKSITYAEALDQALCFGWIDGIRHRLDEARYMIRFTPRKPKSKWSLVNTRRFRQLEKLRLVAPAGRAAFKRRHPDQTNEYSYENRSRQLEAGHEKRFRQNRKAWRFFEAQPPSYRRLASSWVSSAKREETRARRLAQLIEDSACHRRLAIVTGKRRT